MSELKRCPFCGGRADYIPILSNYERPHEVYCFTCDGGITEGRSKDGVIHNWNTRPIEDSLRERAERAEARAEKAEAMVELMIEAGNRLYELAEELDDLVDEFRAYPDLVSWRALVAEWKERKDETD